MAGQPRDNPKVVLCHVARAIKNLHFDIQWRASSHWVTVERRQSIIALAARFASVDEQDTHSKFRHSYPILGAGRR